MLSEHKSTYRFMHYYDNLWQLLLSFLFFGVKRGHNFQPLALTGHENSCVYWTNLCLSVSDLLAERAWSFCIEYSSLLFVFSSVLLGFAVIFRSGSSLQTVTLPYFFPRQEIQISQARYAFMTLEIALSNSMSSKSIHRWDQ